MSEPRPVALVIGDVMLDRRTEGEMSRISPEAPAPVIRQTRVVDSLGGAGNVAANIVALGHEAMLMGVVGADEAGQRVQQLAQEASITTCLPATNWPTIIKHRFTCDGQIIHRVDTESAALRSDHELIAGIHSLQQMASRIKVIVLSDYDKGALTHDVIRAVRSFSTTHNIPIFVDAKPVKMSEYHGVSLLKPNLREALTMLSENVHFGLASGNPATQAEVACNELRKKYGTGLVAVTLGRGGCVYTDPYDEYRIHGLDAVGPHGVDHVRDVCGAGDTTMAALVVGYMEGLDFSACNLLAMQAAGYVVQFYGVHTADRDGVEEFIYRHDGWTAKLMTQDKAVAFVERKRRLNPTSQIVLTNGCFDGFHAGQLETLRFAKRQGDVLVVAYNDDESLRELKGTDRPHVPDSYRSSHLASQEPVDAVCRFDGDVEKLVRRFKPDVLVKGGDSARAPIPGADYVAKHGGRVELCPTDEFYVTVDRGRRFTPPPDSTPAAESG